MIVGLFVQIHRRYAAALTYSGVTVKANAVTDQPVSSRPWLTATTLDYFGTQLANMTYIYIYMSAERY